MADIKKQTFIKEYPLVPSKTTCYICGFLLHVKACGEHNRWYDFIVERGNLFIRNIYTEDELKQMENVKNTCNYYAGFEIFTEHVPIIENALEFPERVREKEKLEDFMRYDLNEAYTHLGEVKDAIDQIEVKKQLGLITSLIAWIKLSVLYILL